jgi:hypothetical protein
MAPINIRDLERDSERRKRELDSDILHNILYIYIYIFTRNKQYRKRLTHIGKADMVVVFAIQTAVRNAALRAAQMSDGACGLTLREITYIYIYGGCECKKKEKDMLVTNQQISQSIYASYCTENA